MPRLDAASISITSSEFPSRFRGRSRTRCKVPRLGFHAIERLRENARRSCFAHAARAGKNIGVRHAAGLDGVRQRARDMLLPDYVRKRLRPPFSRDDLVAHAVRLSVFSSFRGVPRSGRRGIPLYFGSKKDSSVCRTAFGMTSKNNNIPIR